MIASGHSGSYCSAETIVDVDAGTSWTAEHVAIKGSVANTEAEESISSWKTTMLGNSLNEFVAPEE